MISRRIIPALLAAAAAVAQGPRQAQEGGAVQVGVLGAAELREASGLVASRRRDDLLWAVNDSGNRPVLFALGADGRDLGQVVVEGAENQDWEDLAAFTLDGRPHLLIADVGNNTGRRPTVALYVVEEPVLAEGGPPAAVPLAWTQRFRFPDGPKDCEAVAVDSRGPTVVLLSKRQSPPRLYSLALGPTDEVAVAQALGEVTTLLPAAPASFGGNWFRNTYGGQPTALDIALDGRVAVLTYARALIFAAASSPAESLATAPRMLSLPRALVQAEALAFARDGSLLSTSEGRGAPLVRLAAAP